MARSKSKHRRLKSRRRQQWKAREGRRRARKAAEAKVKKPAPRK
ncbi:MAG: aminopeptidase [Myxococcales bacterium]